jgi:hypothetical protein
VFAWADLFVSPVGESVFVAFERDAAPLGDDEGRIALIATTDTQPVRRVKWLQSLTLRSGQCFLRGLSVQARSSSRIG